MFFCYAERDKLSRTFKAFRESKEKEVQDILLAKREVESKLKNYCDSGELYHQDNALAMPGDWLTLSFESEPSLEEVAQNTTPLRGPETIGVLMGKDGPFTNINRGRQE